MHQPVFCHRWLHYLTEVGLAGLRPQVTRRQSSAQACCPPDPHFSEDNHFIFRSSVVTGGPSSEKHAYASGPCLNRKSLRTPEADFCMSARALTILSRKATRLSPASSVAELWPSCDMFPVRRARSGSRIRRGEHGLGVNPCLDALRTAPRQSPAQ